MPKINGSVLIKISRKELELLLSSVRVMIKRCEEVTSSNPYSDLLSDFTKIKNQWSEKEKEYIEYKMNKKTDPKKEYMEKISGEGNKNT